MKWIIDDLISLLGELRKGKTWVAIGLICLFALLAYTVAQFAFKTDAILVYLRNTASACREMTNGIIIFLFCGMIFFLFTALLTLGEVQRYFVLKERGAHKQVRQTIIWGGVWGGVALTIAIAALIFFKTYCH